LASFRRVLALVEPIPEATAEPSSKVSITIAARGSAPVIRGGGGSRSLSRHPLFGRHPAGAG